MGNCAGTLCIKDVQRVASADEQPEVPLILIRSTMIVNESISSGTMHSSSWNNLRQLPPRSPPQGQHESSFRQLIDGYCYRHLPDTKVVLTGKRNHQPRHQQRGYYGKDGIQIARTPTFTEAAILIIGQYFNGHLRVAYGSCHPTLSPYDLRRRPRSKGARRFRRPQRIRTMPDIGCLILAHPSPAIRAHYHHHGSARRNSSRQLQRVLLHHAWGTGRRCSIGAP